MELLVFALSCNIACSDLMNLIWCPLPGRLTTVLKSNLQCSLCSFLSQTDKLFIFSSVQQPTAPALSFDGFEAELHRQYYTQSSSPGRGTW